MLFCEPVATTKSTNSVNSMVSFLLIGSDNDCTMSIGAPTRSRAFFINPIIFVQTKAPFGDGANIIAFLHFNALMTLFSGVAIGLVEGTIAPTTPTGLAISISPFLSS